MPLRPQTFAASDEAADAFASSLTFSQAAEFLAWLHSLDAETHQQFRQDGLWVARLLAGIVIVLVFAATLSSLAVFRVESLEDRVRNRMR